TENNSRYAWWVSAENQKARLKQPYEPRSQDESGWSEIAKSYSVPDPSVFGLDEILDEPETYTPDGTSSSAAYKALNLKSIALLKNNNPIEPHKSFHDFSATSIGLLTNTATGGWRKDLSILSEKWDQIYSRFPGSKLPLFRFSPDAGDTSLVAKPSSSNPKADQSIFYPWSDYLTATTSNAANPSISYYLEQNGAVASWQSLVDFATSYKYIDYDSSSGVPSAPLTWARTNRATEWGPSEGNFSNQDLFKYLHETRIAPTLARVQWVFNLRSRLNRTSGPSDNQVFDYDVDLLVTPVYSLWNPFNVEIEINQHYGVAMNKSFPIAIAFGRNNNINDSRDEVFGTGNAQYRRYIRGSIFDLENNKQYDDDLNGNYTEYWEVSNGQGASFPQPIILAPGEVKVFSLIENAATGNTGVMGDLKLGYDGTNAYGFAKLNNNGDIQPIFTNRYRVTDSGEEEFITIGMRFDNITRLGAAANKQGPGIVMQFGREDGPGGGRYLGDAFINYIMLTSLDFSTTYWDEPSSFPTYSILDIEDNGNNPPWTPVFSVVYGPRISIGAGAGNADDRPTKGVLQNNPFTTAVLTTSDTQWTNHPANIPFDFSVHAHQGGSSPTLPSDSFSGEGFLFTGMQEGDGLSRLILAELPLKPMASIIELQHWNLQGNKPIPPFQYNLIGNSDASPLIQKNGILPTNPVTSDIAENVQHDDAYCANHLLFDDWFFSSIAPRPTNFGSNIARDIESVYKDYLKGDAQLTNRAYKPIAIDRGLSDSDASVLAEDILNSSNGDGWLKIASRLEVEGMFNVNSTSVAAWRALLGQARNRQVAHYTKDGIVLDNQERDYVVSRHTVASDVEAGTNQGMGAAFPSGSEYAGFRSLTEGQIDELAENIVQQIRTRGPFLSLAEFINRQLSEDDDLAIAGALQAALNNLNTDPMEALNNTSNQLSSETMDADDSKLAGVGYAFKQAAKGVSTFGFPGYIRQADILRPIAPVLSARDDTFTIRAYGDKLDAAGNIIARAWCEATVQRSRDYIDPLDEADAINSPTQDINQIFGRRYVIKSFRWLNENEV
ncbi:MAG: hypothetical protein ACNA8H_05675, partial [Anaerolineales bacterium]